MRGSLYNALVDEFHDQEMESILNNNDWYCRFVEIENGQKVGLVEVSIRNIVDGCLSSPVAYLEGLYIKPEHRNRGIGKQVIAELLEWCAAQGFKEFATDAEIENVKAQKLYESLGFEEVDRVVSYRFRIQKT